MTSGIHKTLLLFVPVLLCAVVPLVAQAQHDPSVTQPSVAAQYLLSMANQERTQRNIQPLAWDDNLAAAAMQHAQRMARQNAISHQFPGEPELSSRTAAAGARFMLVAENVAMAPTPQVLHTEWMNSPGHRANLLEPHENAVGIAVVESHGELFAVEDFSEQVVVLGLAAQEAQVAAQLQRAGMADVQATDEARKTCAMSDGYAGTKRPYFVMRYTTSDLSALPDQLKGHLSDKRIHHAEVGACAPPTQNFTSFSIAILLYP